jgi:CarD family transcriptional regulator
MKKYAFKVGEAVFYPSAGVGIIESMEEIYIGGRWESCYVICIKENQVTIKVPQSNADKNGIRPLLTSRKLKELFKVLGEESGQRIVAGNWTEHYKDLDRRINSGSCLELGAVVRDLMRLKKHNGLSFEEAKLLVTAASYLTREIATVENIAPEMAFDRIRASVDVAA